MITNLAVKLLDHSKSYSTTGASKLKAGMLHAGQLCAVALVMVMGSGWTGGLQATTTIDHPYVGITEITRSESLPRAVNMHVVEVDLTAPGIGFEFTSPGGTLETVRQPTLNYLNQTHAQVAVNGNFFLPFPSSQPYADLVGLAASNGNVYSAFETPVQSYAIVTDAPAINIGQNNVASIVNMDPAYANGTHVLGNTTLWNAFSGSAQIITNGAVTVPVYKDAADPNGLLTPNGTYSNSHSWYNVTNARTIAGLTQDNKTLVIFTVDKAGSSLGMTVSEAANLLKTDYGVYNALNLDGGGSTTLAMEDPTTGVGSILNVPQDTTPGGRAEGSNLGIFAAPVPLPPSALMLLSGLVAMAPIARRRIFQHRRRMD